MPSSQRKMFPGFRSRCTTPFLWAAPSALQTPMKTGIAKPGARSPSRASLSASARPIEPLHHDVDRSVGHLIEVEHAHDVRVLDVHLDVRLATQARDLAAVLCRRAAQHFDGDLVPERHVLRGVDDADPARADLPPDAVLPAEHCSRELARRRPEIAAQLEPALERRDAISLERSRRLVLARAVPQVPRPPAERAAEDRGDRSGQRPTHAADHAPQRDGRRGSPRDGAVRCFVPSHVTP